MAETPSVDATRPHALPSAASRLIIGPPRAATGCQLVPPSLVAQTCCPNSQPSLELANRTREMRLGPAAATAAGTGTECQVAPPSRVRASAVHTSVPQSDVPSAQPALSEIRVMETGPNPVGSVPSGGPAAAEPVEGDESSCPWPSTVTCEVRLR